MDLASIARVKGYRNIVRTLKSGPNFGIHGTSHENLRDILNSSDRAVYAHYFGVDANARKIPDIEFYERLWASIDVALCHSSGYNGVIRDNRAEFHGDPCLLLGIEKNLPDSAPLIINPEEDSARVTVMYVDRRGSPVKTFGLGHDFYYRGFVDLEGLTIEKADKRRINGKLMECYRGQDFARSVAPSMNLALTVRRELIMSMIRKIHAAIQGRLS